MATLTRAQFEARKAQAGRVQPVQKTQSAPRAQKIQAPTMTRAQFNARSGGQQSPKVMSRAEFEQRKQPQEKRSAWRWLGDQMIKPLSSASNALEDTGKGIAAAGISAMTPHTFEEVAKKVGFDPLKHQADVWTGKNKRVYSDFMAEAAGKELAKGNKVLGETMTGIGAGADFILDPLNKVKVLGLTKTGTDALKTGKLALSAADQAKQGQRALLQFGNTNILPSVGNKVLEGATKVNDLARTTGLGKTVANTLSKVSTSIRPADISRADFKVIKDAKTSARLTQNYTKDKAIQFAKELEQSLRKSGANKETRSQILHAIEKGDKSLVPKGLEDIFKAGVKFKNENEKAWKELGGSTLEGYGLAHVANDQVAEQLRKDSFKGQGMSLTSTKTPQDIHREWVKVDGKVVKLSDEGIKYDEKAGMFVKNFGKETKDGGFAPKWEPVNVEQATAKEINEALTSQGKSPVFKEDLPTVVARMGISTGRKQAGVEFLEATKGLEGEAKNLANEVYETMTNVESLRKAIKYFDNVQNIWKAQVLVAPSYHIRNSVGNLWNNFLANVAPDAYGKAGSLQQKIATGKLTKVEAKTVEEMKKLGVIGTGQYGGDISQSIANEVGGASLNPLSQRFALYKGNMAVGSAVEDNAKMAHYISKIRDGYTPKQAAESVRKYLFDYGDLTWTEQNVLKRVLPFYTWTRKNVPLQVQSFFETPGKVSNAFTLQRNVENQVEKPEEKYLASYIKDNTPIRISKNEDGTTSYLLLGQWLPSASALQMLTQDPKNLLDMISPVYKVPKDFINNQSFFEDSLGQKQPIEKYPGELKSFLGVDMGAKTANVLRNIRILSELDKLNPGSIFGGKDTPSRIPGGSQNRGAKQSPDAPEITRWRDFLVGKTQTYDPATAKNYYDQDTERRMQDYTQALNQALRFKNEGQAKQIIEEMKSFQAERNGAKNPILEQYNLMGDRFLQDFAKDKQAEYKRDDTRKQMRELIREGLRTGSNETIRKAVEMDPEYSKQAVKDALKETGESKMSQKDQQLMYEIERIKTENRLKPYY